jgi:hypothetical protein
MLGVVGDTASARRAVSSVLATNYAPSSAGPELSTWLFLGALALTAGVALALLRWSISGYHPPEPREDLTQVDPFWDSFDHVRQVELGNGGRSTDDSFAMWHLWSFPGRRELVGMRMAAMPHPSAMGFGSRSGRSLRDPVRLTFEEDGRQVAWEAGPGHRLAMTGMKVLAVEFECPHRDVWGELRTAPDGIDQLCGGTGPAI